LTAKAYFRYLTCFVFDEKKGDFVVCVVRTILILSLLWLAACGSQSNDQGQWNSEIVAGETANIDKSGPFSGLERTTAGGAVWRFDWTFTMLPDAEISVVERPDIPAATTDDQGRFSFDDLIVGDELTIVSSHRDFYPTQSATLRLTEEIIDDFHLQVPPRPIVWALALVLFETVDPDMCQISSTVTEAGGNPFSTGITGATVTLDPPLPRWHGPFYFKIFELPNGTIIDIPVRSLTETTGDGGVVYINVPPGDYLLSAHKEGTEFTSAYLKCRPGVLVNAAPPHGLQRIE